MKLNEGEVVLKELVKNCHWVVCNMNVPSASDMTKSMGKGESFYKKCLDDVLLRLRLAYDHFRQLLTQRMKVVLPLQGIFYQKMYCCQRWRRV